MKKRTLIFVFGVAVIAFLNGCDFATEYPPDSQDRETIDPYNDYYFPDGVYYSRKFKDYNEELDPVEELDRLKANGVVVAQAWYGSPRTSCDHGTFSTHTVVPAKFIILLSNVKDSMDDPDYRRIYSPSINCGQAVKHFRLFN